MKDAYFNNLNFLVIIHKQKQRIASIMTFHKIKLALYSLFLTNFFGIRLKYIKDYDKRKRIRLNYAQMVLKKLQIEIKIEKEERMPREGQYLIVSNHRGIIDPLIVEIALKDTEILASWISKKELYSSPFFGLFVRNSGSILLNRENSQMGKFFSDIKRDVKEMGYSIAIFPEGTRNKSEERLLEFKDGARIIALKNRLPILPIYIETETDRALGNSLKSKSIKQTITVRIGEIISYRQKGNLEELYRESFDL
jgi:1-acyl-sn-glycerol-3-phosphate acyltransferase